ncbi:MAG: HAD family hydrolase [Planctomycetes bacterium]|nr:HAD family hydrolase [Planctomycetota bacterium]
MAPDLLLWDCDGVLVDSERTGPRVLAESLAAAGLPMTPEEVSLRFKGGSLQAALAHAEERLGRSLPPDFLERHRERSHAAFRAEVRAIPGVVEALDRIGLPDCVASGGSLEKMRLTLGVAGLLPRFEGRLFSSYEIGSWKPDPGLFLHAARTLGVPPARCLVVEDSVPGVRAAVAAGMAVLGFADLTPEEDLAAAGARTFRRMEDLPALVRGGAARP